MADPKIPESTEALMSLIHDWNGAVFAADVSSNAKLIAMALAHFADWRTGAGVYASNARIASMCACSVRSVQRARRDLIAAGFIAAQSGAGPGGTTLCRLTLPEQAHPEATTPATSPAKIPTRQAPAHTATVEPAPSFSSPAIPTPPAQLAPPEPPSAPDAPYEDAIKQAFRDVGGACTHISPTHRRLIHAARVEEWTPERLRTDVIANLRDYALRGVSHTPLMLVHDMGTRSIEVERRGLHQRTATPARRTTSHLSTSASRGRRSHLDALRPSHRKSHLN